MRWAALVVVGGLACRAPAPVLDAPEVSEAPATVPTLDYRVWTAHGEGPEVPMPTVIAMHGMGDTPERFEQFAAGVPGVRIIAPRAPIPRGAGHSWFSQRAMAADPDVMAAEVRTRADEVATLIASVRERYAVSGPVVVTGFSQGGMMSFAMAVLHPEAIGAAVPVSGLLVDGLLPAAASAAQRGTPVHALHGTADTVLPLEAARRGVDAMKEAGFQVTFETFPGVGHTVSPAMRARLDARLATYLGIAAAGP